VGLAMLFRTTPFYIYSHFINTYHHVLTQDNIYVLERTDDLHYTYLKYITRVKRVLMMKTIYDIQQYLKKFGTLIYVGDRVADLELMESEVKELYNAKLMDIRDYQMAILLLRHEIQSTKEEKKSSH
jgi:uncharacterized protein YqgQ